MGIKDYVADRSYHGYKGDGLDPYSPQKQPLGEVLDGWSASGDMATGRIDKEVSLQARFDLASSMTIQFGLFGEAKFANAEATITWTVAGNEVQRIVSVTNGMTVNGVGQAARVVCRDVTDEGGAPTFTPYFVNVQISKGPRGPNGQSPVLKDPSGNQTIAAGAFFIYTVPENCGAISLKAFITSFFPLGVPIADNAVTITLIDGTGTIDMAICDFRQFEWTTFVPGTTFVRINNNTAGSIKAAVLYGIDG